MNSNIIIILNALLYTGTLLIYQIRHKRITIGTVVLSLYAFIAIVAIYLFNSPITGLDLKNITIFPFIYLYVILMIMFSPILKFSDKNIRHIIPPNQLLMKTLSVITITLSVLFFIINFEKINIFHFFRFDDFFSTAYVDSHEQLDTHNSYNIEGLLKVLRETLMKIVFILFAYNLVYANNRFINIGLVFSLLYSVLYSSMGGGRGFMMFLFDVFFVYIIFRNFINEKLKKKLSRTLMVLFASITLALLSITFGRTVAAGYSQTETINSVKNYFGQPFLVFNNYCMDAGGTREGDKILPLLKKTLGMQTSDNYVSLRSAHESLKINDGWFYTFVGDFTVDFGPFWAFIILAMVSFLFSKAIIVKDSCDFSQIYLIFLLYSICTHGYSLYPYGYVAGNIELLLLLAIYFLIKHVEFKNVNK
jgi:oligosaccharide repeat unit polymerase